LAPRLTIIRTAAMINNKADQRKIPIPTQNKQSTAEGPLPGSSLYDELIAEGRIQPFALDHARVHFTEAYGGVCGIPPDRLKQLYGEINDHFTPRQLAA
jgi:hypothetical protein